MENNIPPRRPIPPKPPIKQPPQKPVIKKDEQNANIELPKDVVEVNDNMKDNQFGYADLPENMLDSLQEANLTEVNEPPVEDKNTKKKKKEKKVKEKPNVDPIIKVIDPVKRDKNRKIWLSILTTLALAGAIVCFDMLAI